MDNTSLTGTPLVHITGSIIAVGSQRVIQRCALCGMKLVDIACRHTLPTGLPAGTWPMGRFLAMRPDGYGSHLLPYEVDGRHWPAGCCIALVEGADV